MFARTRLRLMASLHQITEQGLGLLRHEPATLCERLQKAQDVFWQTKQELPALLKRIETKRGLG